MAAADGTILALDVGAVRIGLALAHSTSRLARPAGILQRNDAAIDQLKQLCEREAVTQIVVGLPRGLSGQETQQTADVRAFANALAKHIKVPFSWRDEALTSAQAEAELESRGKPFTKADIDALAATYILEDYLT